MHMVEDQKSSEDGKFVVIRRYEPMHTDEIGGKLRSVYCSWIDSVYNESSESQVTNQNTKVSNGKSGRNNQSLHSQAA